jgi:hypothetical protein
MKNTSPNRTNLASSRRRAVSLAGSAVILLILAATFLPTRASLVSLFALPIVPSVLQGGGTETLYLHGVGGPANNPTTLALDSVAPTSATAKSKDSASINRNSGNPWKDVGTWTASPAIAGGTLASMSDLHLWLGLKNSDDQGTYFDVRVEAYKNSALLTSGQTLCVQGVTNNPNNAKEVVLSFDSFSATAFNGTSDALNLKILTRVGTNAAGGSCGGHNNAVGLRVYFDSTSRNARFTTTEAGGDHTAPVLSVTQPSDQAITSSSQVEVTGTYSDQSATTVTVNNVTASLTGNAFSATVPIVEGSNTLLVTATDAAGNSSTVTRHVQRDSTAPVLTITQPLDGDITNQTEVTVTGTFADATNVTVSVNGGSATIIDDTFSSTVPLPNENDNTLTIQAVDAAGNHSSQILHVTRDTVAPVLTLISPTEGQITKILSVSGTATDARPVTLLVAGFEVPVGADGVFSGQIEFGEGESEIHIVASDPAGNRSEVVRMVTIDTTPPIISLVSPDEDTVVDSPASVNGEVADATPVTVTVNGAAVVSGANGLFTANGLSITEGSNNIHVVATDAAGNIGLLDFNLVGRDHTAPAAPTLFPVISPTRLAFQTIQGRAEPGALITIGGGTQSVTANASFGTGLFAASVTLVPGTNTFSATAADTNGNISQPAQISILSDPNLAPPPEGQPSQINISIGNAQKGLTGMELPRPLFAIVTDRTGSPLAGVTVNFTVQAGGGTFVGGPSELNVVTDGQGHASAHYISGSSAGMQQIRATFSGNTVTPAVFLAQALEPV